MRQIPRSLRRLGFLLLSVPVVALVLAIGYQLAMRHLEHAPRTFVESVQWAVATMTTTGFGRDTEWTHPLMAVYVMVAEFVGVAMIFMIFPVFVIPFLEERFQARLAVSLRPLRGHVLVYRYGPAVTSLLDELERADVPIVIFEEDEATARRLHEQGYEVVLGSLENDDPDLRHLAGARALVANGDDEDNAAMALSARYHGFTGPILAMVDNPVRRTAMLRAGATTAFTPTHVLAAAVASRASDRFSPRVSGVQHLGHHLEVAEMRVHAASRLAGRTIAESNIRSTTGSTIVALWLDGKLVSPPVITTRLEVGTILVAVGSPEGIQRLSKLATPVHRPGSIIVLGNGIVGQKVAEFLRLADESVTVVDEDGDSVDVKGDPLDPSALERAGAVNARAVVVTLPSDSAALFAAAVVRSLSPEVMIVVAAGRAENVGRIHRAGADFVLSIGQVAGQLLAFHLLGRESVSLEAEISLVATLPGTLAGEPLATRHIRERTGCTVVAVERGDDVHVQFDASFELQPTDIVHICGTKETIASYFDAFPGTDTATYRVPVERLGAADHAEAGTPDAGQPSA